MSEPQYKTIDTFDRALGALKGVTGVTASKEATRSIVTPLTGEAQTFFIQTFRMQDVGETIFLQYGASNGFIRIAIPPEVARVIYAQRDAVAAKVRRETGRRVGREQAAIRKAKGLPPAFMKKKGKNRGK